MVSARCIEHTASLAALLSSAGNSPSHKDVALDRRQNAEVNSTQLNSTQLDRRQNAEARAVLRTPAVRRGSAWLGVARLGTALAQAWRGHDQPLTRAPLSPSGLPGGDAAHGALLGAPLHVEQRQRRRQYAHST